MESLPYNFFLLLPLLLLPLYFLITRKNGDHQKKANLPPGPPKLPIIGNLHQLIGKPPHQSLSNLSKIYGPVILLQFGSIPTIVVSSAEAAEQVLKTLDLEFCSRPPLAGPKRLSYNYKDLAFAPYGEYWKEIRKICVVELFSTKRVQSFKAVRAEEVDVLIESISSSSNTIVNVYEKLTSFTHKTLCRVAFGSTTGQSRNQFDDGTLTEILNEVVDVLSGFSASDFFPKVGWIIDRITGIHGKTERCFHDLDKYFQQLIDEHVSPERLPQEHEDIIDVLLKLEKDQTSAVRLAHDNIKAILMNIFFGGVGTSAVTINWALAELAKNPKAMKKVQEEIRNHVGSKGKVQESDLDYFPYLKMVVKETLRLHPPGPLLPRESIKHSKINGYDIYPKTRVLVNVWPIGRSPEHWKNPDDFLPERFKDINIDYVGNQNFEYIPFGGGRRVCPGMDMGVVLTELVLANVLYAFDWELPKGMKKEDINMEESPGLVIHKKISLELVPVKYI